MGVTVLVGVTVTIGVKVEVKTGGGVVVIVSVGVAVTIGEEVEVGVIVAPDIPPSVIDHPSELIILALAVCAAVLRYLLLPAPKSIPLLSVCIFQPTSNAS